MMIAGWFQGLIIILKKKWVPLFITDCDAFSDTNTTSLFVLEGQQETHNWTVHKRPVHPDQFD